MHKQQHLALRNNIRYTRKQLMHNHNNEEKYACQYGRIYLSDIEMLHGAGGAEALVYMTLSIHAFNSQRIAFPTVKTMQQITGLSRGSVLRALSKLKDRGAIQEVGHTHLGVVKYLVGGSTSDTTGGSKSDTGLKSDTGGGSKSDTGGVQNLIPIKHKLNNNTKNIKASYSRENLERDEILFLQLWEKWNSHNMTRWEAAEPLKQYQQLRSSMLSLWKSRGYKKSLEHELRILDVFLMEKLISLGKDYSGPARFWAGQKWIAGLEKWLSSSAPSHTGGRRKELLPHAIKITVKESVERAAAAVTGEASPSSEKWYLQSLNDMLEAYEIHKNYDSLSSALDWLHEDMKQKLSDDERAEGWLAIEKKLDTLDL